MTNEIIDAIKRVEERYDIEINLDSENISRFYRCCIKDDIEYSGEIIDICNLNFYHVEYKNK